MNNDDFNVWNRAETLERLGGDEELLQELVQIFVEEFPRLLEQLRAAIITCDAKVVMRLSHGIKGEVSCLGAIGAAKTAQQLENMGRGNDLSAAAEAFGNLQVELAELKRELTKSKAAGS